MDKHKFILSIAIFLLISSISLAQNEPDESVVTRRPIFTKNSSLDIGGWLFPPGISSVLTEPNELSIGEEAMFATYSFNHDGATYNIEFYYRELYRRLRVRVLVGDRELRGLFNRFYDIEPRSRYMLSVRGTGGYPSLSLNFGSLPILESSLNTDAIYDALEAFVAKSSPQARNPMIRIERPPGLLTKTCTAWALEKHLVNEEGEIVQFNLQNIIDAYNWEGIKAQRPEDYERISTSLIKTLGYGMRIDIIKDVNEVPGYASNLLNSINKYKIRPPRFYRDNESKTDYWTCYILERYKMGPLILALYKFGFQNGLASSGERIILGQDNTGAYMGYSRSRNLGVQEQGVSRKNKDKPKPFFPLAVLRITFMVVGAFVLVLAYIVHRYVRAHSRASGKNNKRAPSVSRNNDS